MKIALIKTKTTKIKPSLSIQQQPAAARIQRNRNRRKNQYKEAGSKMETHLTIIGVCTTICPEKSGT
jgi:hypothetical protein